MLEMAKAMGDSDLDHTFWNLRKLFHVA